MSCHSQGPRATWRLAFSLAAIRLAGAGGIRVERRVRLANTLALQIMGSETHPRTILGDEAMKKFAIGASALSLAIGLSSAAMGAGGCNPNGGVGNDFIKGFEGLKKAQSNGGANALGVLKNRVSNNGGQDGEFTFVTAGPNGIVGFGCTDAPSEDEDMDPSAPN